MHACSRFSRGMISQVHGLMIFFSFPFSACGALRSMLTLLFEWSWWLRVFLRVYKKGCEPRPRLTLDFPVPSPHPIPSHHHIIDNRVPR